MGLNSFQRLHHTVCLCVILKTLLINFLLLLNPTSYTYHPLTIKVPKVFKNNNTLKLNLKLKIIGRQWLWIGTIGVHCLNVWSFQRTKNTFKKLVWRGDSQISWTVCRWFSRLLKFYKSFHEFQWCNHWTCSPMPGGISRSGNTSEWSMIL